MIVCAIPNVEPDITVLKAHLVVLEVSVVRKELLAAVRPAAHKGIFVARMEDVVPRDGDVVQMVVAQLNTNVVEGNAYPVPLAQLDLTVNAIKILFFS